VEEAPEPAAAALAKALLRKGVLEEADVTAAAAELDGEGEEGAAHLLRCCIVEANATPQSEWEAGRARARFHVIDGGEE
jgi:hypothetical protein